MVKIITYLLGLLIISYFTYLIVDSSNDFDRDFGGLKHRKVNIDINESLPAGGRQW
ncbi:MAG: hypothetical protein PHE73_09435 [Sulfurovaceae bacterium]|nr:hypothetical protein [Sulfurovaceae bacterium]